MHREINGYLKARKKGLAETPAERAAYVAALLTFAERISDVLEVAAPDAVLVDATPAMGGDGFQKLWPVADKLALGGTNPILVDRVGAELLGLWDNAALARELGGHRTSPLLEVAARRFAVDLRSVDLRSGAVTGDGAAALAEKRPVHFVAMAPFAIHDERAAAVPNPTTTAAATAATDERPTAHAAPLGRDAIQIDGSGDDPAWSRATEIRWTSDFAGRPTGVVTRARFLWSKDKLYALWRLEGAGLHVDTARPIDTERIDLYVEDCIEMMIAPAPDDLSRFYEIQLGPFGHYYDLELTMKSRPREHPAWSSHVQVASKQDAAAHTATIEAAISAPEITRLLAPGATLPVGLFRMEGEKPRKYLAWRPARTPRPNFHVPEGFGALVLDP